MDHWLFEMLDALRAEIDTKLLNPPEGERDAFGYGRITGMLLMIATVREQIQVEMEARAVQENRREREFD